jgi:hypothetical protein
MKSKLTITMDKKVLGDFRRVCEEQGFKMSTKIERLVVEFMKARR